jgi:acyl carrier protein
MAREEIEEILVSVLHEVQTISGREWTDLEPDSNPIGTLDGFDSLSAVETTVMIEQRLGYKLEGDSIFVSEDGKRTLSLREIADRLAAAVGTKGGAQ